MIARRGTTMIHGTCGDRLWTKNVSWRQKVDQGSKGTGCIARNCLRGPIPDSALCAILRPSPCDERGEPALVWCIDGEDVVVGAILCVEHAFLEIRDVKLAARRLNDPAERREEKKRWSCGSPSSGPSPTTPSCMYYML